MNIQNTPQKPAEAVQQAAEPGGNLVSVLADFLVELTAKGYQYAASLEVFDSDIPAAGTGRPISSYRRVHVHPGATETLKIQMQAAFVSEGDKA